ncbi:MAG: TSUP family transporter [Verrucomicrobiota bacterium]|nr:TSUP family transporter [Verrucomicrobiota bacterium]
MTTIALLCLFSLLAGFVDSVVGGGGLIQLPALLILLPGLPVPTIFGTNKLASLAGTSFATYRYSRHVSIDWRVTAPAAASAFVFSFLGSRAVTLLNPELLRPLVLVLLVAVAIYVFLVKDLGLIHQPKHARRKAVGLGVVTGVALGFYDGFFGPGTGSFLIFIFVGVFGFDFLAASASAKVLNLATNLASVLYFSATNHILYQAALPMAGCNIVGSLLGTRMAILKGSRFVRVFFLVIVGAMIAKLAQQLLFRSH